MPAVLGGQEQGEFGSDLRAGLSEELVGEFDRLGEVGVLVDLAGDRVVRWDLVGVAKGPKACSLLPLVAMRSSGWGRGSRLGGCP